MNRAYKINYSVFALLLIPLVLRGKLFTTMLSAFVRPIELLHTQFIDYMNSISYRANAQTCYLQGVLNDEFDFNERRINVRTAPIDFDYYLLWKENQSKPIMIFKEGTDGFTLYLLSRDGLIGANNVDFEIVFPCGYILSVLELRHLRTLVNQNKLSSKKYRIVYE
jgi:hypothetical protein